MRGLQSLVASLLSDSALFAGYLLCCQPPIHTSLQEIERQCTGAEQLIVEGANVKVFTQLYRGTLANLQDLQLADLVGERLPGHEYVAIDFVNDVDIRLSRRCP